MIVDTSEPMRDHYRLQILDPLLRFLGRLPRGTEFAVWTTGDRPNKVVDYGQGTAAAAKALGRTFPPAATRCSMPSSRPRRTSSPRKPRAPPSWW